ncbi:MAG: lipoyl synthase [Desulfobacteraceae bacterium]|nr:lipoyl synthase [Desulfobacteraceae bacterium]
MSQTNKIQTRKPKWLRRRLPSGPAYEKIRSLINKGRLHTVCQEAQCPNQFECFSQKTATFLIMGSRCTRNCRFCNIEAGPDSPPDPDEPLRVAEAAAFMALQYVVVTSVTRDDIPDGGAGLFAETITALKEKIPGVMVEVLIPDFQGVKQALKTVLAAKPDVLNHNIETIPRLYPVVRPQADYERSLTLLRRVADIDDTIPAKSGLMLGLGETDQEVEETLTDLHDTGCRMLTLGQYLQPTPAHLPVSRFIPPEEFDKWHERALGIGFTEVASGPFVRSSYHAKELFCDNGSR